MEFLEFKSEIQKKFNEICCIDLSEIQCKLFFDYMNILVEKNKVMNLTAITEPKEVVIRHFVDSSILLKVFGAKCFDNKKIIDIGTGAGFPGIPLAILLSDSELVLTDTLGKRIKFLEEAIDLLKLNNVKLYKARAEDLAHDSEFREQFEFVVSRGVAKLSVLSEYSLPFIRIGGKMLSYKMNDCDEEINEAKNSISKLGGMFHVKHSYKLIEDEPDRCIVEIEKTKQTPKQFPRKAGTPSKQPL